MACAEDTSSAHVGFSEKFPDLIGGRNLYEKSEKKL